jgi:tellurite resistance protein
VPASARIPLNTLAIGFGLAGLADLWSTAGVALHWPIGIGVAFWIVAAIAWVWLILAHTVRGAHSPDTLASQLRHPVQGPLAALIPVVAMLLGDELYTFAPLAGTILVLAAVLAAALFAAWILGFWMRGSVTVDAIHGGYFLPTVAAALVGATATADIGMTGLAIALFWTGTFFWIVKFALIFAGLALRPPLPGPLVPTLAIFLAPPAVAGGAWFAIDHRTVGDVPFALAALTVLMLLLMVALVPLFRRLAFTLGFWSFTFPLAASGRLAVGWLAITRPAGCNALIIIVLAIVSAVILAIAVRSLMLVWGGRHHSAEATMTDADNAAAS